MRRCCETKRGGAGDGEAEGEGDMPVLSKYGHVVGAEGSWSGLSVEIPRKTCPE